MFVAVRDRRRKSILEFVQLLVRAGLFISCLSVLPMQSLQAVQGSLQCRGNIGYNTKFITGSVSTVTGDIYTVRYTKKRSDTILRITANFDARNKDHMNSCVRYYITIDGEECYPKKLDSILYTYVAPISHVQLHTRQHMTGFCNINSTGEKKITLKLGKCCSNCRFGWPFTGRLSTSMMLVEEVCRPGY